MSRRHFNLGVFLAVLWWMAWYAMADVQKIQVIATEPYPEVVFVAPTPSPAPIPTPDPTATPAPLSTATPTPHPIAQQIIDDMGASEGKAHGITWWPSSISGKVHTAGITPPTGWNAGVAWGQIYRDMTDSQDTNTRVAIRDFRCYLLSKATGKWMLVSSAGWTGGHWPENFSGANAPPPIFRTEPDGSISDKLVHGYNLHFFHKSRFTFNAGDYAGFYATFQARLVLDNPAGINDRAKAKYLMDVGGDWWKTTSAGYCGHNCNNIEIGFSKFKYVTNDWGTVRISTLSVDQLARNPPPQ